MDVRMSNAFCGGIVTPVSLKMAQLYLGGSLQYDGFL